MTIAELTTEQSSSRLRSLVSQNLDLVHKDADLGWFIKANHDWKAKPEAEEDTETDSTANSSLDFPSHRSALATTLGLSPPAVATGYNEATSTDTTTIPSMLAQAIKSETELKADAFPSWATEHLDIGFEVGSLSFLRSAEHQTIMRRLEELNEVAASTGLGDFVRGLSARTISATILLPMESIWNCRFRPVWMVSFQPPFSFSFFKPIQYPDRCQITNGALWTVYDGRRQKP